MSFTTRARDLRQRNGKETVKSPGPGSPGSDRGRIFTCHISSHSFLRQDWPRHGGHRPVLDPALFKPCDPRVRRFVKSYSLVDVIRFVPFRTKVGWLTIGPLARYEHVVVLVASLTLKPREALPWP